MADKGLQIRATVNTPENAKSIDEQIIALSNKIKSKISVKLNIDSKDISFLTTEVNKLKNQVSKSLNVITSYSIHYTKLYETLYLNLN